MRIILFFLFTFYNFYLYSQSTDLKKEYKLTNKYFKEKNLMRLYLAMKKL